MKRRIEIILYSKPGCHLCEEMRAQLAFTGCMDSINLREINIEDDPALMARYQNDIPVVLINGVEAFRHRLSAEAFQDYLSHLPD